MKALSLGILVPLLPRKPKTLEETLAEKQESWGHLPHQAATLPQASPNLSSLAERGHLEVPGVAPSSHPQPSWRPSPSCLLPECPSGWFSLQVSLRERWSKGSTWWPLLSQKQSRLQQRPLRSQAAPPRPLTLVPRCHRWECKAPALETCLNEKHWHCCQMGLHLNSLGS